MLKEILSIQSTSYNQFRMFAYIVRRLKEIDGVSFYTHNGNIYVTRGEGVEYPCMVSHMDTVHDIVEDLYPFEAYGAITGMNRITMEQVGIGGDDKVGVYITLQMIRTFKVFKAVFFRDEEVGCVGSYGADMSFFSDCRFVLQCDRKGNSDFITEASGVKLSSKKFKKDVADIIGRYGYKFEKGMMTDVMALKQNGIGCSVANMSCGYYRPHSHDEYVDIHDVENCLEMCIEIVDTCTSSYPHRYERPAYVQHIPKAQVKQSVVDTYGYDEAWDDYYSRDTAESYCIDCFSYPAVEYGMCKTCLSWYKRNEKF
jgi:putative aminopeptidase FrvX